MIHGINHLAISTGDIEKLARFYTEQLGFEEVFTLNWDKGDKVLDSIVGLSDSAARVAMLKCGNACVELFEYSSPPPRPGEPQRPVCDHGITHLCLQVSDIDAEYSRLCAAGMQFHCAPQQVGDSIRATYGRDPDGNVVELLEAEPGSALAIVGP